MNNWRNLLGFFRVLSIRWLIEYRGCIHDIHAQLFWEQQLIKSKKKREKIDIKCVQIDLNIHLFFCVNNFLPNNLQSTVDLPCPLPVLVPPVFWYFNLNLWQLHFAFIHIHIIHANCAFLMHANNLEFMRLTSEITPRSDSGAQWAQFKFAPLLNSRCF